MLCCCTRTRIYPIDSSLFHWKWPFMFTLGTVSNYPATKNLQAVTEMTVINMATMVLADEHGLYRPWRTPAQQDRPLRHVTDEICVGHTSSVHHHHHHHCGCLLHCCRTRPCCYCCNRKTLVPRPPWLMLWIDPTKRRKMVSSLS